MIVNSKLLLLNNQFKGTYYFLEVNKDCFKTSVFNRYE